MDSEELLPLHDLQYWRQAPEIAFDSFLARKRVAGRAIRKSSFTVYRGMFQRLAAWLKEQGRDLLKLDDALLEQFLETRQLGPETRHRYLLVFTQLYEHLRRLEESASNPARALLLQVEAPARQAPESLTPGQARAVLEVLPQVGVRGWKSARLVAMCRLVLSAGLRSHEVLTLETSDLGLSSVLVRARAPRPARRVPLRPLAASTLATWMQERSRAGLQGNLVFPGSPIGRPLSSATLFRQVREALNQAGISSRYEGPTLLRNTCAAWWLAEAPAHKVQAWLGHERVETTLQFLQAAKPWDGAVL